MTDKVLARTVGEQVIAHARHYIRRTKGAASLNEL
jgi:hypothetical protein